MIGRVFPSHALPLREAKSLTRYGLSSISNYMRLGELDALSLVTLGTVKPPCITYTV